LEGIELFNLESVSVTRYRFRGNHIPSPWTAEVITPTA
jgi:RNA-directed DNA polymerase